MTKCDDKSGYDHVLLHESSQTYFGFEWKESPFIYHTIDLAVSSYLRRLGIPC